MSIWVPHERRRYTNADGQILPLNLPTVSTPSGRNPTCNHLSVTTPYSDVATETPTKTAAAASTGRRCLENQAAARNGSFRLRRDVSAAAREPSSGDEYSWKGHIEAHTRDTGNAPAHGGAERHGVYHC